MKQEGRELRSNGREFPIIFEIYEIKKGVSYLKARLTSFDYGEYTIIGIGTKKHYFKEKNPINVYGD
jgi:hypothetical protein